MNSVLHAGGRTIGIALAAILALSLAAPTAAADPARPFSGRDGGSAGINWLDPAAPGFGCPVGTMFFVEEQTSGQFTHLGRTIVTYRHCASGDLSTGRGWSTKPGSATVIAANGDRLTMSYDLTFQIAMPSMATASGTLDWAVTGGTGRFTHATGSGKTSIKVFYNSTLTAGSTLTVWSGTVSY